MKISLPGSPKRKWGQNFLTDENVLEKIVRYFDPSPTDTVIEIGGGTGALTARIAPLVKRFIVVEIDESLVPILAQIPNAEVLADDFRNIDPASFVQGRQARVIGNLPYYISTPILMQLIEQKESLSDMVLMFQEEVAERILAQPGQHEYSLLSVTSQYFCEIDKGFRVTRNCFYPRPEIDSRVTRFRFRTGWTLPVRQYVDFLAMAFSQRRKKLRNNLLRGGGSLGVKPDTLDTIFQKMEIPENARAENLSPVQFERLILETRNL